MNLLFKIETESVWNSAVKAGAYTGSSLDVRDGFIHLSTAEQVRETARLHFAGQADLVLIAMPEVAIASALKWEASRGGKMFPHVFASLNPAEALWVKPLPWNGLAHDFPADVLT